MAMLTLLNNAAIAASFASLATPQFAEQAVWMQHFHTTIQSPPIGQGRRVELFAENYQKTISKVVVASNASDQSYALINSPSCEAIDTLREYLALDPDWDGEGAPAPLADSIYAALKFLTIDPLRSRWEAALNADGRVSLEAEGEDGEAELLFGPGEQIVMWTSRNRTAQRVTASDIFFNF